MSMLKQKDFIILIINYFAAQTSRFSQYTILIWIILEDSQSSFSVAFVGVCAFSPYIIFGTWGGIIADRFQRKYVLIFMQSLLFCSSTILFILFYKYTSTYLIAYIAIFFNGLIYVIEKPSKSLAIRELLDSESLTKALALVGFTVQASRMIGPLLGGFLISLIGIKYSYSPILVIHIFTVSTLFLVNIPVSFKDSISFDRNTFLSDIRISLDYFINQRTLLAVMLITITVHLFASSYFQMISVVATNKFNVGSGLTGFLMSCEGMGSILGFSNIMIMNKIEYHGRLFCFGALVMCIGVLLFSLSNNFVLAAVLIVMTGFGFSSFAIMFENIILRIVPIYLQGRVLGIGNFVIGFQIIGALFMGTLSKYLGASIAMTITSIMGILTIMVIVNRMKDINKKIL